MLAPRATKRTRWPARRSSSNIRVGVSASEPCAARLSIVAVGGELTTMDPTNPPARQQPVQALLAPIVLDTAPWVAGLALLDLTTWLALPLSAQRVGHRGWWWPLVVGASVRYLRRSTGVFAGERIRPVVARRAGTIALSTADPDDPGGVFLAVWLVSRALEGAVPSLCAGTLAALIASAMAARTMDPWWSLALATGGITALVVHPMHRGSVRLALDRLIAARATASHWLSAAARGRYEILGAARERFLTAASTAVHTWARAERLYTLTHQTASLTGIVAGVTVATCVLTVSGHLPHPTDNVPWLPLAAALAPALAAARALEELRAARRTLAALVSLPAIPEGTLRLPDATAVEVRSVSVRYGLVTALDDVTVTIPLRGVTAIVGPNGAGKSTLAQVLVGRRLLDTGTVTAAGVSMVSVTPDDVVLVPQQPCVVEALSVGDNVRLVAPEATEGTVESALRSLRLSVRADHLAGALSRGEQRRMALARALVRTAKLVVLDEPDAWLDRAGRDVLAETLHAEGRTRAVVLVTHRADLVRWVDHVVVLGANHRVEAVGTPAEVSQHPAYKALSSDPESDAPTVDPGLP